MYMDHFSIFEGEKASDGEGQRKLIIGVSWADLAFLDIVDLYPIYKQLDGVLHSIGTGNHDALCSHIDEEVSKSLVYLRL